MGRRSKLRWNLCYVSVELVLDKQGHFLGTAHAVTVRSLVEPDKQRNILARVSPLVQRGAESKYLPAVSSISSRATIRMPSLM